MKHHTHSYSDLDIWLYYIYLSKQKIKNVLLRIHKNLQL